MKLRVIISKNIRRLRLARELTQQQLADRSGIDLRYINQIEKHFPNLSADFIERLSEALGVTPAELVSRPGKASLQGGSPEKEFDTIVEAVLKFRQRLSPDIEKKRVPKKRRKIS